MTGNEDHLLKLEIHTIFGLAPTPPGDPLRLAKSDVAAVFGWSPNARVLALSATAAQLVDPANLDTTDDFSPEIEPAVVTRLKNRLLDKSDPTSPLTVTGGPSYVFPPSVDDPHAGLPIVVSDAAGRSTARRFVGPDNWEIGEWRQLITGEIGPWAMAVDDHAFRSVATKLNLLPLGWLWTIK